ncbi:DNA replication and repair protein RecF [Flagellatimonas centrodinii]|uniref:DNA replication/repair protein RecF n=1 Tax=Flagellatimonas centrodinii TaxID=2806210 RepID=UPI001FED4DF8|nr:DNA replication and repair protein RecF [Flagellatimonas centrodinii]ULQ47867.1 DNA replication and repair protein RecF [Flagellatimonas centrodinii]
MRVTQLRLGQFRIFAQLTWQPAPGLNLIYGDNAAGKTTLLEAMAVLSRGRSFRTPQLAELSRHGTDSAWQVSAELQPTAAAPDAWRGRYEQRRLALSCNRQPVTLVDAARALPILTVVPGLHRVIDEGPGVRRGLIDWGLFHVEPSFLTEWRQYQRVLRQRNALLKQQAGLERLEPWTQMLATHGERLAAVRQLYVDRLAPAFAATAQRLLPGIHPRLRLLPGWPARQLSLAEALAQNGETDRQLGFTRVGPHRAELRILADDHAARATLSRGQQKLLVLSFVLAQAQGVAEATQVWCPLLIDDWAAELSPASADRVWAVLQDYPGQRWLTDFTPPAGRSLAADGAVFHVEQGGLREC